MKKKEKNKEKCKEGEGKKRDKMEGKKESEEEEEEEEFKKHMSCQVTYFTLEELNTNPNKDINEITFNLKSLNPL